MDVVEVQGAPTRTATWSLACFVVSALILLGLLGLIHSDRLATERDRSVAWLAAIVIAGTGAILLRKALTLYGTVLTLSPAGFRDVRLSSATIPWTEIVSLEHRKSGRWHFMIVKLGPEFREKNEFARTLAFASRLKGSLGLNNFFVSARGLAMPAETVVATTIAMRRQAIEALSESQRKILGIEDETQDETIGLLQSLRGTRPVLTFCLLALLAALFAMQVALTDPDNFRAALSKPVLPSDLIFDGGLYKPLIEEGQVWRVFTAPLLHVNAFHLLMNGIALLFSGYLLERVIGWRWYGSIFALSALAGNLASMIWNPPTVVSVGASGGIVGLFAATVVLASRYPSGALRTTMLVGALRVLVPTLIPRGAAPGAGGLNVDAAGHVGGALGGAIVALLLLSVWRRSDSRPASGLIPTTLVAGFAVCASASFVAAALYRTAFDRTLPSAFQAQVSQSAALIVRYPRDPRVRYARAAALYDEDRNGEAKKVRSPMASC